jgi:hypothetical protein
MEATCSSETLVDFQRTTGHHTSEDRTLPSICVTPLTWEIKIHTYCYKFAKKQSWTFYKRFLPLWDFLKAHQTLVVSLRFGTWCRTCGMHRETTCTRKHVNTYLGLHIQASHSLVRPKYQRKSDFETDIKRKISPGIQWNWGFVGPRAGLEVVVKKKDPCPCQEWNIDRAVCAEWIRNVLVKRMTTPTAWRLSTSVLISLFNYVVK